VPVAPLGMPPAVPAVAPQVPPPASPPFLPSLSAQATSPTTAPLGMPPAVPPVAPLGMPPAVPPIAPLTLAAAQRPVMLSAPTQPASGTGLPMHRLGELLADSAAAEHFVGSGRVPPHALIAVTALAEQAIRMGINYEHLGLGWNHPMTRMQYRQAQHTSILDPSSRHRAEQSQARMKDVLASVGRGEISAEDAVTRLFLWEIGLQPDSPPGRTATFQGVAAALEAELLLPLPALHEGQRAMHNTYSGEPVPPVLIAETVQAILTAVLFSPGGFSAWRYGNPVGKVQLEGLSEKQIAVWREPTSLSHEGGRLRTHEDAENELGHFWATKIGGPSHGFDFEAQCLLPLLANARHKVILISDAAYPHHPCARAHFRMLWTASMDGQRLQSPEPRLWLEAVHIDFDAARVVEPSAYVASVLRHVVAKAEKMEVPVLIDTKLTESANQIGHHFGAGGRVFYTTERLLLQPTNGVCEASDYLSKRHDWVQLQPEVTMPLARALYVPSMLIDVFRGRVQKETPP